MRRFQFKILTSVMVNKMQNKTDMNLSEEIIHDALKDLQVGAFRFLPSTGSTNSDALVWASSGAVDFSLIISDAQTQGRGRFSRRWFTPPGSAIACSVVFRPLPAEIANLDFFTVLGALAVCHMLESFGLSIQPEIKWPNDVLLKGKKVAGILAETTWQGTQPSALILGIGVNILPGSLPPQSMQSFPATCLQHHTSLPISRTDALRALIAALQEMRPLLSHKAMLIRLWNDRLAFVGQLAGISSINQPPIWGKFVGINEDGAAILELNNGTMQYFSAGDFSLRLSK